jgi:hypothetical protein
MPEPISFSALDVLETAPELYASAKTHARGPEGSLPITPEMLLTAPSGNLFGLTQNAGMGWEPQRLLDPEFLILSTHGGLRAADGTPIALAFILAIGKLAFWSPKRRASSGIFTLYPSLAQ